MCVKFCFVTLFVAIYQLPKVQLFDLFDYTPLNTPGDEELYKEALLNAAEFINLYGYPSENHTVYTADGYILTMQRIPYGKENTGNKTRKPVLLMHGIVSSSSLLIDSGKPCLAFYLADHGYDVWLGNMRGNIYTSHRKYSRKQKKFWDFSWEEMADYDVPAMIDYILKETKFDKLPYIAHSMGTTVGFALFSSLPEYQKKVSGFIALSPISSLFYSSTLPRIAANYKDFLGSTLDSLEVYSFPSLPSIFFKVEAKICPESYPLLCSLGIDLTGGNSENIRNKSRDFLYVNHASAGASVKTLEHFGQMVMKKGLYRYDYGQSKNLYLKYYSLTPPEYHLNRISIPVVIFHSANDAFADPIDVTILSKALPNLLGKELVGPPLMNHLDMMYAVDAKNVYQDKLLNYLEKL